MSRRPGTAARATKRPVVVLAGEDRNDRQSLRLVLEEFCPDMRGRIVEITDSVRLRDASSGTLKKRAGVIAQKARARAIRENARVGCAFVQEDLDATDSEWYPQVRDRVQKALDAAFDSAHYVLSVAEIEAWLLLFPDALHALTSSWKLPAKYRNKDTGRLADPKRILMQEVSTATRRYRESDAPDVFEKAVALGCLATPVGSNRSWSQLRLDAKHCCTHHLRAG